MRSVLFVLMVLALVGCTTTPTEPQLWDPTAASTLAGLLTDFWKVQSVGGAQLALVGPEGQVSSASAGFTSLDRKQPMPDVQPVRVGSVTKTFTAVVVLQLVDEGRLQLTDPLELWFAVRGPAGSVTVAQLLNHTSGLPEFLPDILLPSVLNSKRIWTRDELDRIVLSRGLATAPGGVPRYSNGNYYLLARIIEKVTGAPYASEVRARILAPLGLSHSWMAVEEAPPPGLLVATGYDRDLIPLPGWRAVKPDDTSWASSALGSGGLISTASDLAQFFHSLLKGRLISQRSRSLLMEWSEAQPGAKATLRHFGRGLFRYDAPLEGWVGHQGLFVGSEAWVIVDPSTGLTVAYVSNVSTVPRKEELLRRAGWVKLEPS